MKKSYVLIYSDQLGTREQVKGFVENSPLVSVWRFDLPNTFYLVSESSAAQLAGAVREHFKNEGFFLITEFSTNSQGWLPERTWTVLNDKYLPEAGKTK